MKIHRHSELLYSVLIKNLIETHQRTSNLDSAQNDEEKINQRMTTERKDTRARDDSIIKLKHDENWTEFP
jgi:hypothetical protein